MGAGKSQLFGSTLKHCTLWKTDRSPACRAVMMALDAMNLNITEVDIDMDKCEHKSPEMLMMNHRGTLPVFQDRELILCDSHAITAYLAMRYNEKGQFIPRDPGGRAVVDQLMHYDSSVLYPRYRAAAHPILYEGCKFVLPQQMCAIECAYADLEAMLNGRTWLGGAWPNVGDICIASTVSTLDVLVPVDKLKYPRVSSWLYRMSEEPYYLTANKKGLGQFSRRIVIGSCKDDKDFSCPLSSTSRRTQACVKKEHTL